MRAMIAAGVLSLVVAGAVQAEEPARRQPSEAQQRNAQIMRACGQEWRAAKAAMTVPEGQTWRDYLRSCRSRLRT